MMYYLGSHCWLWGGGGLRGTPVDSAPCGSSTRGRIPNTMRYSATYPHQIKRYRSVQIRNACSMWHCALRRWRCGRVLAAELLLLAAVLAGRSRVLALLAAAGAGAAGGQEARFLSLHPSL